MRVSVSDLGIFQEAQLLLSRPDPEDHAAASALLTAGLEALQQDLAASLANYDLYLLYVAVLLIVSSPGVTFLSVQKLLPMVVSSSIVLAGHFLVCSAVDSQMCQINLTSVTALSMLFVSISTANQLLLIARSSLESINIVYIFGLLHSLSLLSSSFVEEEHQTVYFFLATLIVTNCLIKPQQLGLHLAALAVHRLLRAFNQVKLK